MTHYLVGKVAYPADNPPAVRQGRPVVVIDPDNAEQVEAFSRAWDEVESVDLDNAQPMTYGALRIRAALRSLIAPDKPAEPQGLGAVVEDADGAFWVRHTQFPTTPWTQPGTSGCRRYSDITAVKVLSEGVTP